MNSFNNTGKVNFITIEEVGATKILKATFSIGVKMSISKKEIDSGKKPYLYRKCEVWGKQAEFVRDFLKEGDLVSIQGQLREDTYTNKQGVQAKRIFVKVNQLDFPLTKEETEALRVLGQSKGQMNQVQSQQPVSVVNTVNQMNQAAQQQAAQQQAAQQQVQNQQNQVNQTLTNEDLPWE